MSVFDIIFPKRCVGCGRIGRYFCLRCRLTLPVIAVNEAVCPICGKPAIDGRTHPRCRTRYCLDGLTAFFRYAGVVRLAVKTCKYRYVFDLVPEFASLVPDAVFAGLRGLSEAAVVPVPLHTSRFRGRGFNQAQLMGAQVAARLHIPMQTDMLRRTKPTAPQAGIATRQERLANAKGVFVSERTVGVSSVLLVDDVFTTGATLRAAACALKRAGVHTVWGVVFAR